MYDRIRSLAVRLTLAAALVVAGHPARGEPPSLFTRIGGLPVLEQVAASTIDRSAAGKDTRRSFEGVNLKYLKAKLTEQFCEITGGPCKYSGDTMKLSHQGLNITEAEFNGLVQHLRDALDESGVGQRAKNELLKLLAPMKRDIVTH
jgi:hemoglobin